MTNEFQKWIDIEHKYLNKISDTIFDLEKQLHRLSFDIHYEAEGKGFSLIWCKKQKRIIYLPDDGIACHLHQVKIELREKVIKHFDGFKDHVIKLLKERHESKQ